MTERERKIQFIIDSMWHLEDVQADIKGLLECTDEEIDKEVEWYEYLWTK